MRGNEIRYRCSICGKIYREYKKCRECVKKHRLQNLEREVNVFIFEKKL